MNTPQLSASKLWTFAASGIASLALATSAQAAFTAPIPAGFPETPGALLGAGSGAVDLTGTVIDSKIGIFSQAIDPFNTSGVTLRTMVVDRDGAGPGTFLDFYYQVVNTSTGPSESDIFRLGIGGGYLDSVAVQATYATSLAGLTGVPGGFSSLGNKTSAWSADREPNIIGYDDAAFDFDTSQFLNSVTPSPQNIFADDTSQWLVLRTDYSTYVNTLGYTTGGNGSSFNGTFAPVPEPSTILFGLAMIGFCVGGRLRKSPETSQL